MDDPETLPRTQEPALALAGAFGSEEPAALMEGDVDTTEWAHHTPITQAISAYLEPPD